MEAANQIASGEQATLDGTLRISASGAFAEKHISQALVEFAKENPTLNIELDFSTRLINFVDDGFDFAIRNGTLQESNMVARKLTERTLIAAASPVYLKQHGTPKTPKDLLKHKCLIAQYDRWKFQHKNKTIELKVPSNWRSNNARAITQACKSGLGIAYMAPSSYGNSLESGELPPILTPYSQHFTSWIVYPSRKYLPLRAHKAIDYLLSYFKDWREGKEIK